NTAYNTTHQPYTYGFRAALVYFYSCLLNCRGELCSYKRKNWRECGKCLKGHFHSNFFQCSANIEPGFDLKMGQTNAPEFSFKLLLPLLPIYCSQALLELCKTGILAGQQYTHLSAISVREQNCLEFRGFKIPQVLLLVHEWNLFLLAVK